VNIEATNERTIVGTESTATKTTNSSLNSHMTDLEQPWDDAPGNVHWPQFHDGPSVCCSPSDLFQEL